MDTARRFDRIEKELFHGWVKRNPLLGSRLGFHKEFDSKLPDGSYGKVQDDIRFLKRQQAELKKLDPKDLKPRRRIDLELALHVLRQRLFEMEELRLWAKMPQAPRLIGECVFQLLSRNYAPLRQRLNSIIKRLEQLPRYIDESRDRLREPVETFIESELETITRLPGFFHVLKDVARNALPKTPYNTMCNFIEDIHNALERYSDWLIIDVLSECGNDYAIGEELFRKMLRVRGITEPPSKLHSWGEGEMNRLRERLRELARKVRRRSTVEDVRDLIRQQHHDNFDGVLRFVRDSVQKSRQFVVRSNFAPIPQGEALVVTETPSYLCHILPLGGYWPPAPFEQKKEGFYLVTPGDCDSDKLKEHNYASLANMTVHEGYPGHHLQFSWQIRHPSLIRNFAHAPETIEGWAHYCEERVRELGYDDAAPNRFMMLTDLHWRATRVVHDVRLHTGRISIPKAVEMLIDETGKDRVTCEGEVRRYLTTPGYPLSYLYGKERMKDLKKWARGKMKSRFEEAFFHEAVLQAGALPMPLLRRELEWRIEEKLEKAEPVKVLAPKPAKKGKKKKKAAKQAPKRRPLAKKKPVRGKKPVRKKKPALKKKPARQKKRHIPRGK
ncbi:MAG: DUF885 domain-containing protein [Planctomycetota bacterium]|jgi:uncharacterized protein (DUF885 family)